MYPSSCCLRGASMAQHLLPFLSFIIASCFVIIVSPISSHRKAMRRWQDTESAGGKEVVERKEMQDRTSSSGCARGLSYLHFQPHHLNMENIPVCVGSCLVVTVRRFLPPSPPAGLEWIRERFGAKISVPRSHGPS